MFRRGHEDKRLFVSSEEISYWMGEQGLRTLWMEIDGYQRYSTERGLVRSLMEVAVSCCTVISNSIYATLANQTSDVSSTDPARFPPLPKSFQPNPETFPFSTTNSAVALESNVEKGVVFFP